MIDRSRFALTLALALAASAAAAYAQSDARFGTKLGLMQLSNSGQLGEVTLFGQGASTLVKLRMDGAGGRAERAIVVRNRDCDEFTPGKPLAELAPLAHGSSTTTVAVAEARLLSGNYSVVVFASARPGAGAVACGHLYQ